MRDTREGFISVIKLSIAGLPAKHNFPSSSISWDLEDEKDEDDEEEEEEDKECGGEDVPTPIGGAAGGRRDPGGG